MTWGRFVIALVWGSYTCLNMPSVHDHPKIIQQLPTFSHRNYTREGAGNLSLPNATELRNCWEVFHGLRDKKSLCRAHVCRRNVLDFHAHLSKELTALISNTAISQWQKVVEQGSRLNWVLVHGKISQSWAVNEVFVQKSGVTRQGIASCRDVSEEDYDLLTSTH